MNWLARGASAIAAACFVCLILWSALACGRSDQEGRSIVVFAAASTTLAVQEVAALFEEDTGVEVKLSFAASSTLARQIEQGARADVFLSADSRWMRYLEERERIEAGSRADLLSNELVLVAPADSTRTLELKPGMNLAAALEGRLSIGDPEHVPAGKYAREALEYFGVWEQVRDRLAPAPDARAALQNVALGEMELGIVYATDAASSNKVRILATLPERSHSPIRYPVALVREARPEGRKFFQYLQSGQARRIFEKHGFGVTAPRSAVARAGLLSSGLTREEWAALRLSIKVGVFSVLVLLIPGIACGWLLARRSFPGKTLFEGLVYLPLVLPPVVVGYVLLMLLGRHGLIGRTLHDGFGIQMAFTWQGAVLAAMIMAFPLMVRSVRLAIEMIDREVEDASRTLGAGPLRVFATVTLPLAVPGIIAGAMLAFARSLGEFGATITFAGNIFGETRTLPLAIFSELQAPGGEQSALRLVLIAIVLSMLALVASQVMARAIQRRLGGKTGEA